jgi:hypothetical protein
LLSHTCENVFEFWETLLAHSSHNALTWGVLGHKLMVRVMTLVTLKKIFQMTYWAFQWEVIWSLKLSFMKLESFW